MTQGALKKFRIFYFYIILTFFIIKVNLFYFENSKDIIMIENHLDKKILVN